MRYDLLKPASIERVLSVFSDGPRWGGTAGGGGAASFFMRLRLADEIRKSGKFGSMTSDSWCIGDGGSGGKPSFSGLDAGGEGGRGPNDGTFAWDKSISLELSDLWTPPGRNPRGRRGGGMSEMGWICIRIECL